MAKSDLDRVRALRRWFQFTPQEIMLLAGIVIILMIGLWARWRYLQHEPVQPREAPGPLPREAGA